MTEDAEHTFESVCMPLYPDCYAFALSLTRRTQDAEDLLHDTFMRAHRAFDRFKPGTNAKAWLFTILRRLHIDSYRRARIRPTPLPEEELTEMARDATAPVDTGGDDLPWDSLPEDAVWEAIEGIPEPFRLAVRLRDLDGFTYRQIAEILDVPAGTVMSRLHRGREYLRRTLVELADPHRGEASPRED